MKELESKENNKYIMPPIDILDNPPEREISKEELIKKVSDLQRGLYSFKIKAKVKGISVGPVITFYELEPEPGVSVRSINNGRTKHDIEYLLGEEIIDTDGLEVKYKFGVATKNKQMEQVFFKDIISSDKFKDNGSNLLIGVGKNISGEIVTLDLKETSHILVSGMTGSGKSVFLSSLICSVLYKANPNDVRLVLIDTKQGVETSFYDGIPHLLCPPIKNEIEAYHILKVLDGYLDVLYNDFSKLNCKNIDEYNKKSRNAKMFNTLIVIDKFEELCDSMYCDEVRASIDKIAMKGEKVGMYLVIATSKPQVSIISGTSKNNIKTRIAFKAASSNDSSSIIEKGIASDLFGDGDMLIKVQEKDKFVRCKGAFLSDDEINRIVENIKDNNSDLVGKYVIKDIPNDIFKSDKEILENDLNDNTCDPLLNEAIEVVVRTGVASTSYIQKRFKVGYARAGRIIDQIEERGIISGYQGSKPREVLISKTRWESTKNNSNVSIDSKRKL